MGEKIPNPPADFKPMGIKCRFVSREGIPAYAKGWNNVIPQIPNCMCCVCKELGIGGYAQ